MYLGNPPFSDFVRCCKEGLHRSLISNSFSSAGQRIIMNTIQEKINGKERKSRNTIVNSPARRVTGPQLTESLPLPPKAPTHRRGIQAAISPRNERCNRDRGDRAPLRYPGGRPHEAFQHRFQPHGRSGHGCWRPPCAARACYIIRYTDEN